MCLTVPYRIPVSTHKLVSVASASLPAPAYKADGSEEGDDAETLARIKIDNNFGFAQKKDRQVATVPVLEVESAELVHRRTFDERIAINRYTLSHFFEYFNCEEQSKEWSMSSSRDIPKHMKFILGGSAGMSATLIVHPLDFMKNRMQLSGKDGQKRYRSSYHAFKSITSSEGILVVYNGLSASLVRQATYTSTRLGVYTWLMEHFMTKNQPIPYLGKVALGMTAGVCGALVGNPVEVVLIRMCVDGHLPVEQRRNYKNVFHALYHIVKFEGATTLYRGCSPTVVRCMVLNATQLSTYSQAKQFCIESTSIGDGFLCHVLSSMISGLASAITSLPVDILKTRLQAMTTVNNVAEYKGLSDVFLKVLKREGVFAFWKGFTPYFLRMGPYTVLSFLFLEQFNAAYSRRLARRQKS
ncbi:hypothetical protein RB195_018146 [Necator americanus]|uniref:Uncharacterized protein n=2 Tax=Necator americanus TaxID=51031 RepID=A0ABR1C8D5_NECAM